MLLHEILARDRMRDDQLRARRERLARRLATAAGGSGWSATPTGGPAVPRNASSQLAHTLPITGI